MLILTRRVGETLMIGDEVTVTVLGVKGNRYVLVSTPLKKSLYIVKKSTSVSGLKKIPAVQLLSFPRLAFIVRRIPPAVVFFSFLLLFLLSRHPLFCFFIRRTSFFSLSLLNGRKGLFPVDKILFLPFFCRLIAREVCKRKKLSKKIV